MRIPDPKAVTAEEAYLGYKAEIIEESELKPSLYEPYLHFDGWLAYWTGLTTTYPAIISKKNLFGFSTILATSCTYTENNGVYTITATANSPSIRFALVKPIKQGSLTMSGDKVKQSGTTISLRGETGNFIDANMPASQLPKTVTPNADAYYVTFFTGIQSGQTLDIDLTDFQIEVGSTPTEYEPYSTPEMLCDEEALVAYLSGVTDTYPEEIKDPYDVRITGYLRYLCSYRFGRPEYPVTNSEFYLSLLDAPHTSNETPSADIELDTSDGKLIDVKAYGDIFQQTYSGKNLLNLVGRTNGGVTGSVNPDNTVTISGTATITDGVVVFNYVGTLPAGTYTFSISKALPKVINFSIASGVSARIPAGSTSATLTTTQEYTSASVFFGVENGATYDETFNMQLVAGSTADYDFEPYVGGIASPNPDYPQDIQVVTGEQTVNVHGKNLFDKDNTLENKFLSSNGTWSNDNNHTYNNFEFNVSPGENLSISFVEAIGAPNIRLGEYTSSGAFVKRIVFNTNKIVTVGDTTNKVIFSINQEQDMYFSNLQIEKSNQPTTYEPYQSQDYLISLGNMFDANTIQAGDIRNNNQNIRLCSRQSLWLDAGTYTFSTNLAEPYYYAISINSVGAPPLPNYPTYTYDSGWKQSSTLTFTLTQGGWVTVAFKKNNYANLTPADVLQFDYQLNRGSSVITPIELAKIGTYQDYIYKSGDDWYVHKETGKTIVTGSSSETWLSQTTNVGYMYRLTLSGIASNPVTEMANLRSDYFTPATGQQIYNVTSGGYISQLATAGYMRFNIGDTTDKLSDFKTWLSSHNTTVYYALATPTDTKITDSTLIGELDALAGADTYDEKTFIKVTATDPNLPALLKVEAYKY